MLQAWDADGHVEEWEGTFSDQYFDPEFQDRRPVVIDPDAAGFLYWKIDSRPEPFKFGGSPTSKGGVPSLEQRNLSQWRGSAETAEFRTAAVRTALMDDEHIALQVNYPTMLLAWPVAPDPALNQAITRSYNNWMADVSSQDPDRMKWVTVIDPGDPKAAAKEIERTKEMGSVGVMMIGVVGDKRIDDSSMEPIWAAAAETGLPVAIHPGVASNTPGAQLFEQFHFSVLIGFDTIVTSGLLDRYPNLRVSFLETSCQWVDFMVWRATEQIETIIQRREAGLLGRGNFSRSHVPELMPEEYIKAGRLYFGYEATDAMLPHVIDRFGPDPWLYASDIPHAHRLLDSTNYILEREDIGEEAKRKILVDNTARFYGLPLP